MPVTRTQAEQLAPLVAAARPHGARQWDLPGIVAAIGHVQHLNLADVAAACFRAAADRTLQTPAAIGDTRSSAWRERLTEPVPTRPVICRIHGTQYAGGICPSCRADQLANDTTSPPGTRLPADQAHDITLELHNRRAPATTGAHSFPDPETPA